jgi:hypothetical protein
MVHFMPCTCHNMLKVVPLLARRCYHRPQAAAAAATAAATTADNNANWSAAPGDMPQQLAQPVL